MGGVCCSGQCPKTFLVDFPDYIASRWSVGAIILWGFEKNRGGRLYNCAKGVCGSGRFRRSLFQKGEKLKTYQNSVSEQIVTLFKLILSKEAEGPCQHNVTTQRGSVVVEEHFRSARTS